MPVGTDLVPAFLTATFFFLHALNFSCKREHVLLVKFHLTKQCVTHMNLSSFEMSHQTFSALLFLINTNNFTHFKFYEGTNHTLCSVIWSSCLVLFLISAEKFFFFIYFYFYGLRGWPRSLVHLCWVSAIPPKPAKESIQEHCAKPFGLNHSSLLSFGLLPQITITMNLLAQFQ